MGRLLQQRVVQQVAHVDEKGTHHDGLPDKDEQRGDRGLLQKDGAQRERDVCEQGHRDPADLAARQAPPAVSPDRSDDHPGRAALEERLKDRKRREVEDPVTRREVRRETRERAGERDQRFGHAEPEAGRHAEDKPVDRLRKVEPIRQEQRRQRLQRLLHDRHQQTQEQQRANAGADVGQRVAHRRIGVEDRTLDQRQDQADHGAAPDREAEDDRRLVAIDLGLVEVDQVQDRHQEGRDQDRRGDQPGEVQDDDPREADRERPAELVDLVLAEVREQRGEN